MSESKEMPQSSTLQGLATKGPLAATEGGAIADLDQESQMTCSVLCELSASLTAGDSSSCDKKKAAGKSSCAKQLQLPMFLSKTYHMIEKCDPEVASWSEAGDNFVVKNVEKFATSVLPLYFKHSNFSSFARQLNFYGFRKLRSETILTSDIDPRTACYVRFYHEKFQRDKPELLHHIKRATKSEQHSKDDMDSLKSEITRLRESQVQMKDDYDRRLAELSYECNRRITSLTADLDKLFALVQPTLRQAVGQHDAAATAISALRDLPTRSQMPDLLHSLSHAAVSLQNHLRSAQGGQATLSSLEVTAKRASEDQPAAGPPSHQHFLQAAMGSLAAGAKRPAEDHSGTAPSSRPRFN